MLPESGSSDDPGQLSALCLVSENKHHQVGLNSLLTHMFIKQYENSLLPWNKMVLRCMPHEQSRKVTLENTLLESVLNSVPSFRIIRGKSYSFFQLLCLIILDKEKRNFLSLLPAFMYIYVLM